MKQIYDKLLDPPKAYLLLTVSNDLTYNVVMSYPLKIGIKRSYQCSFKQVCE